LLRKIRYKLFFLAALAILALLVSIPSFTKNYPEWLRKTLPTEGMRLGLDLQGGMQLILKVNLPKAVQNRLDLFIQDLKESLRNDQIEVTKTERRGENDVRLYLFPLSAGGPVERVLGEQFPNLTLLSSSLEEGKGYLDVGVKPREVSVVQEHAVSQTLEIIRNRIDQFGVTEPSISRQGSDEIVIQLPGIKDPKRAIDLIGKTAELQFKLVDSQTNVDLPALIDNALKSGALKPGYTREALNRALECRIPPDDEIYLWKRANEGTGRVYLIPVLLTKRTLMTGDAIATARVAVGGQYNRPYVTLSLNSRGARLFDRITQENVGRQLAIVLDNVVQSAPVIEERISGGEAEITGAFTDAEASDLAIVLRAGALPAPVDIVQNLTVGPSLGGDSIRDGVASAILATMLVICFMMVYYRLSGIIADLALFLNLVLMAAALSLFRATLTLPGIAGIILSIGMAVDSNVLVFERMREEFAVGRSVRSGVDAGYDKALWTIIDSHITTLITAFALFLFGTGPIKGFAVTLSLGVIFNLFTALFGTRAVYDYLTFKHTIRKIRFLQLIEKPGIDFIRLRKAAFLFSGALVLLGIFASVEIYQGKANLGVDFAGGTVVQFKAEKHFGMSDVREALAGHGLRDYELQEVPRERILIVRMKSPETAVGSTASTVSSILAQAFPQNRFHIESEAAIGSSVSKDLRRSAMLAIAISLAGVIVYLAWRFNLRFGVAATIATFHDVLAVLGLLFLLHKEITLLIVTALLTLAGYSLTDTVVVFDRIRENLRGKSKLDLGEIINLSINEVLSRTLITSSTVFLVLMALLVLGGAVLRDFALALSFGVIVGTYSSIFVASPIIYVWSASKMGLKKSGRVRAKT
jgi:SecD/SecF fusion protein